jgi:membrane fusion protein (multidrug efflux system)
MYNPELTYVTAHLEETKLEGVAPGNWVRLDLDAFAEPFRGRVVWINRATGANFALVPRNLSAGEFTKVVQRVPIRIVIEQDERWPRLRPGLSATVAISHGRGDPDWARQAADTMRALESRVAPAVE